MSASDQPRTAWLESGFWERLARLEERHRQMQSAHQRACRSLEHAQAGCQDEVRRAWRHYCEVLGELERAAVDFESLRT